MRDEVRRERRRVASMVRPTAETGRHPLYYVLISASLGVFFSDKLNEFTDTSYPDPDMYLIISLCSLCVRRGHNKRCLIWLKEDVALL